MIKPVSRNTKFLVTRNIFLRSTVRFSYCMKFSMILHDCSKFCFYFFHLIFKFRVELEPEPLLFSRFRIHNTGEEDVENKNDML